MRRGRRVFSITNKRKKMELIYDDGASVRHALLEGPINYATPAERDAAIATLRVGAARAIRDIAGNARVGKCTELEAIVRARGGDVKLLQMLKMFEPTKAANPSAHRLDKEIARLESHQTQRLETDSNARLARFMREIREREQAPVDQAPQLSEAGQQALAKVESLEQRLLFQDTHDVSRLVRAALTKRQLLEGDEAAGLRMFDSVVESEKQLASERKQRLAERQDELRREMASIDPFDLDPKPDQQPVQPERSIMEQTDYEVQQALNEMYRREKEAAAEVATDE